MSLFLGHNGHIKLRRTADPYPVVQGGFPLRIRPEDISTVLNRAGFDGALDNIITGDKIEIRTDDERGLLFFPLDVWPEVAEPQKKIAAYVNINAAGGLRFFANFADAVNNNREVEYQLVEFTGDPIDITFAVRDVDFNILGKVQSYELNTEREDIDTTSLNDRFRQRYSAGLISGNGQISTLFDPETTGIEETPLLMLQVIQRLDIGSRIDLALYLSESETDASQNVYYEVEAMIVRSGVSVNADAIIEATIDFVTTGEIRLLVGQPSGYLLKEDEYRIQLQQSLDFLLTEVED